MMQLLLSLRPKQWSKNVIVFAGLLFAEDIFNPSKIKTAALAFVCFCLISSAGYLINDVMDRDKDALHPRKKNRPIAAGTVSVALAIFVAVILTIISMLISFWLGTNFGLIITVYLISTVSYSIYLKKIIIIDVIVIASGFMFRAIGGTLAIQEQVSSWLILCTIFLALFLALTKRRAEAMALGENAATIRTTYKNYGPQFLDNMINTVTAACLIAYALYTLDPATVAKFHTRNLVFTMPFVIYFLFRYLFLVYHRNMGEAVDNTIMHDRPILICSLLYALTVITIIYL
jgi:4-hydroxybenzoate polyprenyltransferase